MHTKIEYTIYFGYKNEHSGVIDFEKSYWDDLSEREKNRIIWEHIIDMGYMELSWKEIKY